MLPSLLNSGFGGVTVSGHSPASAAESRYAALLLSDSDGELIDYDGPALQWDLAKSDAITLEFKSLWFADRSIEIFAWSDITVELGCRIPGQAEPSKVTLRGRIGSGTHFEDLRIAVPAGEWKQLAGTNGRRPVILREEAGNRKRIATLSLNGDCVDALASKVVPAEGCSLEGEWKSVSDGATWSVATIEPFRPLP